MTGSVRHKWTCPGVPHQIYIYIRAFMTGGFKCSLGETHRALDRRVWHDDPVVPHKPEAQLRPATVFGKTIRIVVPLLPDA